MSTRRTSGIGVLPADFQTIFSNIVWSVECRAFEHFAFARVEVSSIEQRNVFYVLLVASLRYIITYEKHELWSSLELSRIAAD